MKAIVKLQNADNQIQTKTIKLPAECGPKWYEAIEKSIKADLKKGWFMKSVMFAETTHGKTEEEKQKLKDGFMLRLILMGPYALYYVGEKQQGLKLLGFTLLTCFTVVLPFFFLHKAYTIGLKKIESM